MYLTHAGSLLVIIRLQKSSTKTRIETTYPTSYLTSPATLQKSSTKTRIETFGHVYGRFDYRDRCKSRLRKQGLKLFTPLMTLYCLDLVAKVVYENKD